MFIKDFVFCPMKNMWPKNEEEKNLLFRTVCR